MEFVSPIRLAAVYDGTNSAVILDGVQTITQYTGNTWTILSEDAEKLVLCEESPVGLKAEWEIPVGTYVVVDPGFGIVGRMSPEKGAARYRPINEIFLEAAGIDAVVEKIAKNPKMQAEIHRKNPDQPNNK